MIGIIIARKNSKRLPGKNIKPLNWKPLIEYTIEQALNSNLTKIVIGTDDENIIEIAYKYNLQYVTLPDYLTTDKSDSIEAIFYCLDQHPGHDKIVLLQCTSPLRTTHDINYCLNIMNKDVDFITSVYKVRSAIIENGALFCAKIDKLREKKNWYNDKTFFYLMPENRSIDIDDKYDFIIAERLMKEME